LTILFETFAGYGYGYNMAGMGVRPPGMVGLPPPMFYPYPPGPIPAFQGGEEGMDQYTHG